MWGRHQREAEASEQMIRRLQAELQGLDLAIGRYEEPQTEMRPWLDISDKFQEVTRWRDMYRTDAIVEVMRRHGVAAGPAEIARWLAETGREDDTPVLVSASLDHLKHQKRVTALGRGQWVAIEPVAEYEPDPDLLEELRLREEAGEFDGFEPDEDDFERMRAEGDES